MDEQTLHTIQRLLPEILTWRNRPTADSLVGLPGCPAVFLFTDENGAPLQLLTTQQLKRVAVSKLEEPEDARRGRVDLAEVARAVRWRRVHSPFEARWRYWQIIRLIKPERWLKEIAFGPAWFIHVDWRASTPEPRITERIWRHSGEYVGPWPSRSACRQALEGLWDLFDLCRYPAEVRKSPNGQKCAYADMGRCDAPCADTALLPDYVERVRAALRFAAGAIDPWIETTVENMKLAAGRQEFEQAAIFKRQIEFARRWKELWSKTVRPHGDMNYLLAVPVARRKAWKLFLFRLGHLAEGPLLSQRKAVAETEAWLTEQLKKSPETDTGESIDARSIDEMRMVQTWLVAHFLRHKESKTAVVLHLKDDRVPENLAELLNPVGKPDSAD